MNFLREIVSGPKNRFRENGYNLDLTYICPRLIAMSFPASGVESVYRNPIDKVTKFIKEKHQNNYLVFNLSGRMYNYQKFQDQVLDYQWEDHHSPPIHTLFQICQKMQAFLLSKKENVCIIHCLAGKGRTGTIICCFLLYSGLISTPDDSLHYYSKKRFIQEGFGVNQPCQIRYLKYFDEILKQKSLIKIYPKLVFIKAIKFKGRPNYNTQKGCRPYFDLIYVKTKELIYSTKKGYSDQAKFEAGDTCTFEFSQQIGISGDILIRMKHNGYYKNQKMARISFNTAFIPDTEVNSSLSFSLEELSPSNLIKDSRYPKSFVIEIIFGKFCGCTRLVQFNDKCSICKPQVMKERDTWEIMQNIVNKYSPLYKNEQRALLFTSSEDDIDEMLHNKPVAQRNRYKFDSKQDKFVEDGSEEGGREDEEDDDDDDDEEEEDEQDKEGEEEEEMKNENESKVPEQMGASNINSVIISQMNSNFKGNRKSLPATNVCGNSQNFPRSGVPLQLTQIKELSINKENSKKSHSAKNNERSSDAGDEYTESNFIDLIDQKLDSINRFREEQQASSNELNEKKRSNSIKTRKRSDVKHNIYSNDAPQHKKTKFISIQHLKSSLTQEHLECDKGEEYEAPPSPLNPKNSYANKKDNDTDNDSPFEDCEHNHPKHSRNLGNFQKDKTLKFDRDSFDDLKNDTDDDPSPQKPVNGDKIFTNTMKHF